MKSVTSISLIILVLFFGSCDTVRKDDQISGAQYSVCYIQDYIEVENLSVRGNSKYLSVVGQGKSISGNSLCTYYNDRSYNREIVPHSTEAITNCFTAIDIVSDSDFDERHKAGASLADITFLAGASPYDYIQSGYTKTFDWKNAPLFFEQDQLYKWYNPNDSPIYIRLSEIDNRDLILLNPIFFLTFESQPTLSKSHRLTLTIIDEKSKSIVAEFDWSATE